MTKSLPFTALRYRPNASYRIHEGLLQQLDEAFALGQRELRRDFTNVHLMSSAFRRLDLAFNDLRPFVTDQSPLTLQISIRGMADALGEIHCQDMAILALEEVAPQAPRELAQRIQQSIETRKKIRRQSRQTLERLLASLGENIFRGEFERMRTTAAQQIGNVGRRRPGGSLKKVATSIIQSHLNEFEKCSTVLNESPQAMRLGALDRATQRLQYAIELFSDCWTADVRFFSSSLAHLENALSKVSDYDFLIKEMRKQMLESKKTNGQGTKKILVFLFAQFTNLRNLHFDESFALWNAWESDQLSSQLRKTIARSI